MVNANAYTTTLEVVANSFVDLNKQNFINTLKSDVTKGTISCTC